MRLPKRGDERLGWAPDAGGLRDSQISLEKILRYHHHDKSEYHHSFVFRSDDDADLDAP